MSAENETSPAPPSDAASSTESPAPASWEALSGLMRTGGEARPDAAPPAEPPSSQAPAETAADATGDAASENMADSASGSATVEVTVEAPARQWHPGKLKLVIEQGMSVGKEFLVSEPDMLVGRRDPEQAVIPDIDLFDQEAPNNRYVTRRHARLYFAGGSLMLEDLDSANGTGLNGQLVAPHEPRALAVNDKVHFGQSVLMRLKTV